MERWRDAQGYTLVSGEPNDYGGKEDCAMARFASKKDSGWNDVSCESKLAVVCQDIDTPKEKAVEP